MCTGNGDVALPYGDVHYFGLGLSVMIFLVIWLQEGRIWVYSRMVQHTWSLYLYDVKQSRVIGKFCISIRQVFIQAVGSPFMKNCSVALALFFGFFVAGVSSYTAEDGTSLPYVNGDKIDQAGVFTFLWTAPLAPHGCFLTLQPHCIHLKVDCRHVGKLRDLHCRASDEWG